jgi:hypothetical protein
MKRNSTIQDTGWNVSFWFAITSPLFGVLFAIITLAIFRP